MKDRSIQKAMDEIGGELHAQYTLGYRPAGDNPTGYHEIKVEIDRPGITVRTRPGYYIATAVIILTAVAANFTRGPSGSSRERRQTVRNSTSFRARPIH